MELAPEPDLPPERPESRAERPDLPPERPESRAERPESRAERPESRAERPDLPPERSPDPEVRLQHARDLAWRALNRRDHTVAEIARMLTHKRVEPAVIDTVVGELCEQGYLDDARFARRFAEGRRRLDGWGAERIERRLLQLGIERDQVAAAVGCQGADDELAAAVALLRRRFPQPPATPRDCERALGMLVRRGYELELAHDAIRQHAGAPAFD